MKIQAVLMTALMGVSLAAGCSTVGGADVPPNDGGALPDGPPNTPADEAGDGGAGADGAVDGAVACVPANCPSKECDPAGKCIPPGTPALQYVGRFDFGDALGGRMAWPGTRVVARFDGTAVDVKLSQIDGFSTGFFGPTWMNVIVDCTVKAPFMVTGTSQDYVLATGLAPGSHVVELEKRTEANSGTIRFEGFTFTGGTGLLAPPPRPARRIEFLSDSTVDGFGVEGVYNDPATCNGAAPAQYSNARKGTAFLTASALSAEQNLIAYSGKGFTANQSAGDTAYFQVLYSRTLPEVNGSAWSFAQNIPDAVVISAGGIDVDGVGAVPGGFETAYDALVGTIRTNYPNAHIFLTVWSQIKDGAATSRTALFNALTAIRNGRAADTKIYVYQFPLANFGTDETGCFNHANAAHHQAMAVELVKEMKLRTGW